MRATARAIARQEAKNRLIELASEIAVLIDIFPELRHSAQVEPTRFVRRWQPTGFSAGSRRPARDRR